MNINIDGIYFLSTRYYNRYMDTIRTLVEKIQSSELLAKMEVLSGIQQIVILMVVVFVFL